MINLRRLFEFNPEPGLYKKRVQRQRRTIRELSLRKRYYKKPSRALATLCSSIIPHLAFCRLFFAGRLRMTVLKIKRKGSFFHKGRGRRLEARQQRENGKGANKREKERRRAREREGEKGDVDVQSHSRSCSECKSHASRSALYANARLFNMRERGAREYNAYATRDATTEMIIGEHRLLRR